MQDDGALVGYSSIDFSTVFAVEPRDADGALLHADEPCSISWRADGRYLVALVRGKLSVFDVAKRMVGAWRRERGNQRTNERTNECMNEWRD